MSTFEDTVARLSARPVKTARLHNAVSDLRKHAAAIDTVKNLFGAGKEVEIGGQKILQHIAQTVGAASIVGSGALLFNKIQSRFGSDPKETDARAQEMGRMHARNNFKIQQNVLLNPLHGKVYKVILKDDVISRADKDLVASSFETMKKFAPNLAADENAARSFVLEHVIHGSRPGYATLKNLAEAEQAIANAGGNF
jgi:hypothetical protein